MMHKHLTIALVATLVLTAVPAMAQTDEELGDASNVSIEDMLLQQALSGQTHINTRMAERILQLQEQLQLQKLAAAEAARMAAQSSSSGVEHAAAPTEESTNSVPTVSGDGTFTVNANGETITLSAASLRLLARLQNRTNYPNPALHSGAPLAPSGPGTILAVFAMALAVGFTYLRAWRLEKRHRD